ncbi:SDR family oxidoreductase [Pseudoduganella sp. OTU4001]|uniref:SDR family oxidoreductase n=1 Tax=Pseudoduganella sp. OTU4001 TaxID=3043854 RepID=UPI00313B5A6B
MKIVVIGGTGLIGGKLDKLLQAKGHEVLAASPGTGVNAVTGDGLAAALAGAQVVVDVANSPSFAPADVLDFFQRSTRNLGRAEKEAGVRHHVALSIVGTDRLPENGYFGAKLAQEELIAQNGVPYSILRATQFMEFLAAIGQSSEVDGTIRLSPSLIQPVAADDVAAALADVALATPINGIAELAGPEAFPLEQIVRRALAAAGEQRPIATDPQARYFGSVLEHGSLVPAPGSKARLGAIHYDAWLKR